ncbi:AN1-type zinc finger protein 2B [Strigomonas culicis]|uniref:AN1-type zinc finger protein 2B n=1 Tax=Strigomonas culicis TaxID=28005 RepID=S9UPU2_9TRYP|nr:AN1-type zinc finger protein 2B [Strigomonas culicis]|eukprot:EPY30804.1 AN1-type zinc finger protein 2B [Strigomonas culicis]
MWIRKKYNTCTLRKRTKGQREREARKETHSFFLSAPFSFCSPLICRSHGSAAVGTLLVIPLHRPRRGERLRRQRRQRRDEEDGMRLAAGAVRPLLRERTIPHNGGQGDGRVHGGGCVRRRRLGDNKHAPRLCHGAHDRGLLAALVDRQVQHLSQRVVLKDVHEKRRDAVHGTGAPRLGDDEADEGHDHVYLGLGRLADRRLARVGGPQQQLGHGRGALHGRPRWRAHRFGLHHLPQRAAAVRALVSAGVAVRHAEAHRAEVAAHDARLPAVRARARVGTAERAAAARRVARGRLRHVTAAALYVARHGLVDTLPRVLERDDLGADGARRHDGVCDRRAVVVAAADVHGAEGAAAVRAARRQEVDLRAPHQRTQVPVAVVDADLHG